MKVLSAAVCVSAGMSSCAIVSTAVEVSRDVKKYPVEIVLHEGETISGEAKLPNGRTKTVKVKGPDGNKTKVKSAEIATLTAWNAKAPDSRFILVFQDKTWRSPKAVGKYIAVFAQGADYYINKKGEMTIKGNVINFYGLRPGDVEATFIVQRGEYTSNKAARKALLAYFADDPDLCNAIEAKEIAPFDFDRICEEYCPVDKR